MNLTTATIRATKEETAQAAITFQSTAKAKGKLTTGSTTVATAGQGDTVTLSPEAMTKAKTKASTELGATKQNTEETKSATEKTKDTLTKRIKEIQKRLQEIQKDEGMSEDAKKTETQALQAELMQLMNQLAELSGGSYTGGTQVKGMAKSLT